MWNVVNEDLSFSLEASSIIPLICFLQYVSERFFDSHMHFHMPYKKTYDTDICSACFESVSDLLTLAAPPPLVRAPDVSKTPNTNTACCGALNKSPCTSLTDTPSLHNNNITTFTHTFILLTLCAHQQSFNTYPPSLTQHKHISRYEGRRSRSSRWYRTGITQLQWTLYLTSVY